MLRKLAVLGLFVYAAKKFVDRSADGASSTSLGTGSHAGSEAFSAAPAQEGPGSSIGHAPTDLSGDTHPDGSERADEHFRPDPHAAIPPEDLEGLRPVTFEPARQRAGT